MNHPNENQHYLSRPLLTEFKLPGQPLQCYQLATGAWKERSVHKVCSAAGYHQLLLSGVFDNSLEDSLSKEETHLPRTLKALKDAATREQTNLPAPVYDNLCRYCTFLKLSSPAAKAAAAVNLVLQLNMEVEIGQRVLLKDLAIPEEVISVWRKECAEGHKVIVDTAQSLQAIYRYQFSRSFHNELALFRLSKWTVWKSPIELPMSDIGLVPLSLPDLKANCHLLPITPMLLLVGVFFFDVTRNSAHRPVKSLTLSRSDADHWFDAICASATDEIICSRQLPAVVDSRVRARTSGIGFNRLMNAATVKSAGLQSTDNLLRFRVVSGEEYVRFVHSFMMPPSVQSGAAVNIVDSSPIGSPV